MLGRTSYACLAVAALGLLLSIVSAHAQTNFDAARRRLLCAQMGYDITDMLGRMMFQRCLQQGPAATVVRRPVGPIPQLVHPVGPLVTPVGPLVSPSGRPVSQGQGDGCRQGFVWREAVPGDHVCVDPGTRQQARNDNAAARARVNQVDHSYGPDSCQGGFVWREATPSDHVCVVPDVRAQARADNGAAAGRVAR